MRRMMLTVVKTGICCSLILSTACEDPKKRIAELEEEKKVLGEQLLETSQERDAAQAEAAQLKQRSTDLEAQLAQAKQAPPPAPPAPAPILAYVGSVDAVDLGRANQPELSAKAKAALNAVAVKLKAEFPDKHVYIIGHTDNDPIRRTKWKDNLELSCQRAMAVTRYLASRGIRNAQLLAAGAGEFSPLVPNTSKANKAKNRRIEIYAGPAPTQ